MRRRAFPSLVFIVVVLLAFEALTRARVLSPLYFPSPSKVARTFFHLTADGVLPINVAKSFLRMAVGYTLAAVVMIPTGILMGSSRRILNLFEPVVELLRPVPPPVLVPVVMLFLGIGDLMRVFVVFFACTFPIISNAIDGARRVQPLFIDTARSFDLSRRQIIVKVIFPAASPQIMSGLRVSLPIALIVTILSEMIGSVDGIGLYIIRMQRSFSIPEMYAGIAALGLMGYAVNRLFLLLNGKVLGWYSGWRGVK